jgi:hypothetical protein
MHTYSPAQPYGAWVAYQGTDAIVLAAIIAVVAVLFATAGMRLRRPIALTRPGPTITGLTVALWLLSMLMMFVALLVYGVQLKEVHIAFVQQKPQIGTVFYAAITFAVVAWLTRKSGFGTALGSGFVAAIGAPMLFELPFDLIVMARVYPPVPPDPGLYRALFFCPLFLIELSTLALLAMSPCLRITRGACFALAGMFAVWVVWAAAFGFAYPVTPGPLAVNVVSKILCFVAAILLFVWRETPVRKPLAAS